MNKMPLIVVLLLMLLARGQAHQVRMQIDMASSDYGIFADGKVADVYLRVSSVPVDPLSGEDLIIDETNSVWLGKYTFNSSLTVSPTSFDLGPVGALITDGVDEYLGLVIKAGGTTVTSEKKESIWFSTASDLVGSSVVSSSFRIDEIRVQDYPKEWDSGSYLSYIDMAVDIQAIPEPEITVFWFAVAAIGLGFTRKRHLI